MNTFIRLHLCVNSHHNGEFSGLCREITLDDCELLTLESLYFDRHLKCDIEKTSFRLGKAHCWAHHGCTDWYGNWCWAAVKVTPACAADVLNFVISRRYRWTVAGGIILRRLKAKEPIQSGDLLRLAIGGRDA